MTISLEVDRHGAFLRLGRIEAYARRDRIGDPSWAIIRGPGSVELEAGRFRLTVSKAPETVAALLREEEARPYDRPGDRRH